MNKVKLKITMISSNEKVENKVIGNYDKENKRLEYVDRQHLLTTMTLDLENKTLTRENKDYKIFYKFSESETTINNILMKDLNKELMMKIKTNKWSFNDNELVIDYTLLDGDETIIYKVKIEEE